MTARWLTAIEVAALIRLSPGQIRKMLASGEIPASNISSGHGNGKRWRVKQDDLDRWIEGRTLEVRGRRGHRETRDLGDNRQMLTTAEVMAQLGVTHDKVQILVLTGDLRAANVAATGVRYRVYQLDLDRWMEGRRNVP